MRVLPAQLLWNNMTRCSYTLANGDTYDGEWLDDRKNGKGM